MSVHIQESVRIRNVCPHLMSTRIQSLSISDSVRRSSSKCHRPISTSGPIASTHRPVVPNTPSSPDMFERKNADLVVTNHQACPSPSTMQNPTQRPLHICASTALSRSTAHAYPHDTADRPPRRPIPPRSTHPQAICDQRKYPPPPAHVCCRIETKTRSWKEDAHTAYVNAMTAQTERILT